MSRLEEVLLSGGILLALLGLGVWLPAVRKAEMGPAGDRHGAARRLREVQRIAALGLWEWDIEADRMEWSRETYEIFCLSPDVFKGRLEDFAATICPEDRDHVLEAVDAALHRGAPYRVRHRIVRPDGTRRWVEERARVVRDAEGRALRMVGTVMDVTDITEALQRAAEHWALLEETGQQILILHEEGWRFREATRGALENLGYGLEEMESLDFFDVFPDLDAAELEERLQGSTSALPAHARIPTRARRKDGSTYPAEVELYATIFGGARTRVVLVRDLSEQRRLINRLRQLAGAQERAREEERAALARDLHDALSQTLSAAGMDLALLKELEADPEALAVADRLSELVHDSLEEVHRVVRRLRPGPLNELGLVAAIEWLCDQAREASDVRYDFRTSGAVPEPVSDVSVVAFRVVQEALTNVRRHAGATHVSVHLEAVPDGVRITVEDDGRGAAPADLARGYGLLGMRERVVLLGGTLEIDTEPERGFRLVTTLPLAPTNGIEAPEVEAP
ncbi:MAG: PAS domain-containing protein [Gemmatimonadota bacterium]